MDDAVEPVGRRRGAGQFRAPDLAVAWQRVSGLVYATLAPHLTNVSHLIVCPDGQLSRLPFEMLLVSKPGGPPRYLVEEKTISYVGSGREVARLANPLSRPAANLPMNLPKDLGRTKIGESKSLSAPNLWATSRFGEFPLRGEPDSRSRCSCSPPSHSTPPSG